MYNLSVQLNQIILTTKKILVEVHKQLVRFILYLYYPLDRRCGSTLYFSTLTSDKNFYAINKLCFQPSSVRILVILSFNQFVFMVSFRTYNKSIFCNQKISLKFCSTMTLVGKDKQNLFSDIQSLFLFRFFMPYSFLRVCRRWRLTKM